MLVDTQRKGKGEGEEEKKEKSGVVGSSIRNCAVVHIRNEAKEEKTIGSVGSSGLSASDGARRRTDGQEVQFSLISFRFCFV